MVRQHQVMKEEESTNLSVVPEDLLNLTHPAHIEALSEVGPHRASTFADETTMLSREADVLEVAEVFLEELAVTTRDDIDDVLGIG